MNDRNIPTNNDLPSVGKLIKSTILAIFVAAIILITVVLPAEYGIDPFGVGAMLGLAKMGEIKVSLAQEAAMETLPADDDKPEDPKQLAEVEVQTDTSSGQVDSRNDKITLTLEPNQGKEIKLTMAKGSTVNYSWYTDGGEANFDAHADSKTLKIKYHNYEKGKLEKSEGIMEAAFDGNHGWFWRNRTTNPMTVTLEVDGSYTDLLRF